MMTAKKKKTPRSKKNVPVQSASPKERLNNIVQLVISTAEAKGRSANLITEDKTNYRYATVEVSRFSSQQHITAEYEIMCDKRVNISYQRTSFYGYGLEALYKAVGNEFKKISWLIDDTKENTQSDDSELLLIERLLRRFHALARQLRHRLRDRQGIVIQDEYDVQDVLHSVLRGLFDDVRAEEYTPSYAGGASRIDFLLKSEKIAIEVKMASESLRDKHIGEQLLGDIGRYQSHQDCECLICFVYDPFGNLKNPSGLETDLSKTAGELKVKVIVVSV